MAEHIAAEVISGQIKVQMPRAVKNIEIRTYAHFILLRPPGAFGAVALLT
jgi:hypothetical protein